MNPRRQAKEWRSLLHRLNQRCRNEFDRAERLQAELNDIRQSRLWRWLERLRGMRRWMHSTQTLHTFRRSAEILRTDPSPANNEQVSIIIPFKNDAPLLAACLRSLRRTSHALKEVILVDNGSTCAQTSRFLKRWLRRHEGKLLTRPGAFNFSWLCNEGARQASGEVLLFLNNDTEALHRRWLQGMLAVLRQPGIGIVGATLFYPDGTLQHAGIEPSPAGWHHPHRGRSGTCMKEIPHLQHVRIVPAVTGACLMLRRAFFEGLNGFDERLPVTMNDVDLCQRAHALGWSTAVTPHARLLHYESMARGYARENAACPIA